MEADWEIEVGGDAPVIDGCWEGYVDLRRAPERVVEVEEATHAPLLADALLRLNGAGSSFWTAKCDLWAVDPDDLPDSDELDGDDDAREAAFACYIDLLPLIGGSIESEWSSPESVAESCREFCRKLRSLPLRNCRADLVVRAAVLTLEREGFGVTAYLHAAGANEELARQTLDEATRTLVGVLIP